MMEVKELIYETIIEKVFVLLVHEQHETYLLVDPWNICLHDVYNQIIGNFNLKSSWRESSQAGRLSSSVIKFLRFFVK